MTPTHRREAPPLSAEAAIAAGLDEAMVRAVVDRFYALAREDAVIGPVFARAIGAGDWPAHLAKIADFWSASLLGTRRYHGRPMPKHLALPELGDAHFRRWLAIFRHAAGEICPPEAAAVFIDRSERIANAFRVNIAARRDGGLAFPPPLGREDWP